MTVEQETAPIAPATPEEAAAGLHCLMANHSAIADHNPLYDWLREHDPIAVYGPMRFLTRYDDLVKAYRDPRISRHQQAVVEVDAFAREDDDEDLRNARAASKQMLINQDEPGHKRIRQILEGAFKPSRVTGWRARVEAIMDELIGNVEGRLEFDLLREIAYPLPERVICELMGVPHADHELWGKWTEQVVSAPRTHKPTPEQVKLVNDGFRSFYLYFRDLVAERKKNLGDDLVSALIRAESEGDRLSEQELLGTLMMLIQAGHETTANLIGNGMHTLLLNQDQYEKLRADPGLIDNAVEEMLRYASPAHWSLPRRTLEDVELPGGPVPAGCPMMMSVHAANRDPAMFDAPNRFDVERPVNRHVAFAAGPHFCLGNQLARQEAQVTFRAIVTRLPRLELAEAPRHKVTFVRALDSLHVRVAG